MARTKNNFLNAKPVSKMGGKSGGVRKPGKPYSKPPAKPKAENPARWDAKTKSERLQQAAKTKPKSAAPKQVITKPVTRTGPVKGPVPPKGSSSVSMPNSRRAGVNLPQAGARAERTAQRVMDLKKASATKASTPKPSTQSRIGRGLVGKGSIAAMALGAANAADDARLTPAQRAKKYEVVNPDRGQNLLSKLQSGKLGTPNTPKPKQGNAQSRFAGAREANMNRINNDPRFAAPKEKPKPQAASRPNPPAASTPPARPSATRPSQTSPSSRTTSGSGSPQRAAAANRAVPAGKQPSTSRDTFDRSGKGAVGPNYGIDQFGDKNGVDMERRRAFLDSKDSQSGRKAVNKLIEERRKKQRENDSTSK